MNIRFVLLFLIFGCDSNSAKLSVLETFYFFDHNTSEKVLKIENTGDDPLDWEISGLPEWASANPSSGRIPPMEFTDVTLNVSKLLNKGSYGGLAIITSNGGSVEIILQNDVPLSLEVEAQQISGVYKLVAFVFRGRLDNTGIWSNSELTMLANRTYTLENSSDIEIWPASGTWAFAQLGSTSSQHDILRNDDLLIEYVYTDPDVFYMKFFWDRDQTVPEQSGKNGLYEFTFNRK